MDAIKARIEKAAKNKLKEETYQSYNPVFL
jgi:hypothetical protein